MRRLVNLQLAQVRQVMNQSLPDEHADVFGARTPRQRWIGEVEVLMVQHGHHFTLDNRLQITIIHDKPGLRIDPVTDLDNQIVATTVQVGALAGVVGDKVCGIEGHLFLQLSRLAVTENSAQQHPE